MGRWIGGAVIHINTKQLENGGGYSVHEGLHTIAGMHIYPMIFQGRNVYVNTNRVTDKTYWIHHGTLSWFHKKIGECRR